ncbi:MAG: hypothetical protein RR514_07185 [Christensenella sp.]
MQETQPMPQGTLLDLWECHKRFLGLSKAKRELYIDEIITFGI